MSFLSVSFAIKWIVNLLGHYLHLLTIFSLDRVVKINMFFHGCYNFVMPLDLWYVMKPFLHLVCMAKISRPKHHYGKDYIS
jgi:hypothetical protein